MNSIKFFSCHDQSCCLIIKCLLGLSNLQISMRTLSKSAFPVNPRAPITFKFRPKTFLGSKPAEFCTLKTSFHIHFFRSRAVTQAYKFQTKLSRPGSPHFKILFLQGKGDLRSKSRWRAGFVISGSKSDCDFITIRFDFDPKGAQLQSRLQHVPSLHTVNPWNHTLKPSNRAKNPSVTGYSTAPKNNLNPFRRFPSTHGQLNAALP